MLRTLWRSFSEPMRSLGSIVILVGCAISLWFTVTVALLLADRAAFVPWMLGSMADWTLLFMAPPVLALTLPLISGEAKDRTLLLNLMEPVTRTGYYTGRVAGRALFAGVYFAVALGVLYLIVSTLSGSLFREELASPVPPDLAFQVLFSGLSLISVVFSLCVLAPVSSTRYAHVAYWVGMWIVVEMARDLHDTPTASFFERNFSTAVLELLQPFLVGADPRFVAEAALGDWHLARALLQWAFGVALAYLIGIDAFSRMEMARRV